jgi:Tfp pilus assembly protein PilE
MRLPTQSNRGFTLIEILLAFLLFVVIYSVFAQTKGGSEQNVRQNSRRDTALRLLQTKMAEVEMKIQNQVDRNGVETSFTEDSGKFEDPYSLYSWKSVFQKASVEFGSEALMKFLTSLGMDKDEALAQVEQQKLLITNLNKNVIANFGELRVEVSWDYLGVQKLYLVTHVIPKKPKISLTTTAEN